VTETVPAIDESKLLNKAIASSCRFLAMREHSEKQIRQKLLKKAYDQAIISSCVAYLRNENWLSDERFCNAFIRSRIDKEQGLQRILYELHQQNIQDSIIQEQIEQENINWQEVCDKVLLKKISNRPANDFADEKVSKGKKYNPKDRKKITNFLIFRGFSTEEINTAFKRL